MTMFDTIHAPILINIRIINQSITENKHKYHTIIIKLYRNHGKFPSISDKQQV